MSLRGFNNIFEAGRQQRSLVLLFQSESSRHRQLGPIESRRDVACSFFAVFATSQFFAVFFWPSSRLLGVPALEMGDTCDTFET